MDAQEALSKLKKFYVIEIRSSFSKTNLGQKNHSLGGLVLSTPDTAVSTPDTPTFKKKSLTHLQYGISPKKKAKTRVLCLWGQKNVGNLVVAPSVVWEFSSTEPVLGIYDIHIIADLSEVADIRNWPTEIRETFIIYQAAVHSIPLNTKLGMPVFTKNHELEDIRRKVINKSCSSILAYRLLLEKKCSKKSDSKKRRNRQRRRNVLEKMKVFNKIKGINKKFLSGNSQYWSTTTDLLALSKTGDFLHCFDTLKEAVSRAFSRNSPIFVLPKIAVNGRKPHLNGFVTLEGVGVLSNGRNNSRHMSRGSFSPSVNRSNSSYFVFIKEGTNIGITPPQHRKSPRKEGLDEVAKVFSRSLSVTGPPTFTPGEETEYRTIGYSTAENFVTQYAGTWAQENPPPSLGRNWQRGEPAGPTTTPVMHATVASEAIPFTTATLFSTYEATAFEEEDEE